LVYLLKLLIIYFIDGKFHLELLKQLNCYSSFSEQNGPAIKLTVATSSKPSFTMQLNIIFIINSEKKSKLISSRANKE